VAVLLDKFVSATAEMEMEERQIEIEKIKKKVEVTPTLRRISPWSL
jgi:hypothetical protein